MGIVQITHKAGQSLLRHCGDWLKIELNVELAPGDLPTDYAAFLRTTLGCGRIQQAEIIHAHTHKYPVPGASWRDIPMIFTPNTSGRKLVAAVQLPLHEVGTFEAKPYIVDKDGNQIWSQGDNIQIIVHPDCCRTQNTIYCAFPRLFYKLEEQTPHLSTVHAAEVYPAIQELDKEEWSCIPPSGKLRDLIPYLPHIVHKLGCKIIHLLPVGPTPTTMARMGRFGSPYAAEDLTGIDPALVVFEHGSTGIDQFRELADAIHSLEARLIIDLAINHTGWGSTLQCTHPEWYVKDEKGEFVSPGAWGVTWGDLCELNTHIPDVWAHLAGVFLTWCERGVDGFRCDAGYKVPVEAWRYIIARVHARYPDTIFLLEGLGGSWEATENLLTHGLMQMAYSELFQNYSGRDVAWYLDYALSQSQQRGIWVHYSETHDNNRLAEKGRQWSLFRNQLCALTSVSGGYGFTCGVEWLAKEKIIVHQRTLMNWGSDENIVEELARLNRILSTHPAFFDNVQLERLSHPDSAIYVLKRTPDDGDNALWIFANTDMEHTAEVTIPANGLSNEMVDLLTEKTILPIRTDNTDSQKTLFTYQVPAGTCWCLSKSPSLDNLGCLTGDNYRQNRAMATWALMQACQVIPDEKITPVDWQKLAETACQNPALYLGALMQLSQEKEFPANWFAYVQSNIAKGLENYPAVIHLDPSDPNMRLSVPIIPTQHWLLMTNKTVPFRVEIRSSKWMQNIIARSSIHTPIGNILAISPKEFQNILPEKCTACTPFTMQCRISAVNSENAQKATVINHTLLYADADIADNPYNDKELFRTMLTELSGKSQYLLSRGRALFLHNHKDLQPQSQPGILLTNARGGMTHICADLGSVQSKYDCLLGANLSDEYPVDRHIFVKRVRIWANADGFISQLSAENLALLSPEAPAKWDFVVSAGNGRIAHIRLWMDLLRDRNTVVMRLERPTKWIPKRFHTYMLKDAGKLTLTIRLDIEDRSFHTQTELNDGALYHFRSNTHADDDGKGFRFVPDEKRQFHAYVTSGIYHSQEEICRGIPHPVEGTRGQPDHGDAFSPGWFQIPLAPDSPVHLIVDAERDALMPMQIAEFIDRRREHQSRLLAQAGSPEVQWEREIILALDSFLVRRGKKSGKTIIAGYPWFLDWGRDTLIAARGYIAAGYQEQVLELLQTFGKMERDGTLPNVIYGSNDSNRDTSDAPLWYGIVAQELATKHKNVYTTLVDDKRTILDVLKSIANGYIKGTPNGICVDPTSGLVWSPSHFTWMDTKYPTGTPRTGYPIEIQALWINLLRQLEQVDTANAKHWATYADKATQSLQKLYWLPGKGWFADGLWCDKATIPAHKATKDDALRPNQYFAIAFGFATPEQAHRATLAGVKHLLIPGAIRTLAPLPVDCPAPVYGNQGGLLNDPFKPYWHTYTGDEDTRRKPAYHNGTAWVWVQPTLCEAIAVAWKRDLLALTAARAYLRTTEVWMTKGMIGHLPEVLDGSFPHSPRGCDAQAWSVSETVRVNKILTN